MAPPIVTPNSRRQRRRRVQAAESKYPSDNREEAREPTQSPQ